ncbi:MAG: DinB family protein [Planctomycetota bacterium]|jgi:uncharacterized damage-inducible protein DinB
MDFQGESIEYLREIYMPRMRTAVEGIDPADTWWRPHEGVLSIGNILLHLAGNVRQWIVAGLGGAPDARDRGSEFAATEGADAATLLASLEATVGEACDVIAGLDDLDRACTIQGFRTTPFRAVYHVVEHFSWHTGQAVWIAKARGAKIAFYDDSKLNE